MKFMILSIITIALFKCSYAHDCSGEAITGQIQEIDILKSHVQSPYQLAIDRDTNTLFFSYTTGNTSFMFESVYINLKDKSSGVISGVDGGFAHAVDNQKQIVYIGGRDGIYKFNYANKNAERLNITEESIWQMFFKDGLYFTSYPAEKAYIYKDGIVELVPELKSVKAMLVALDRDNNLVFAHDSELKKVEKGNIVSVGNYAVNAFNTDADGILYFSTPDGIYRYDDGITKLISLNNVYGFAIENESSLIFAADDEVTSLKLMPAMCVDGKKKKEVLATYSFP